MFHKCKNIDEVIELYERIYTIFSMSEDGVDLIYILMEAKDEYARKFKPFSYARVEKEGNDKVIMTDDDRFVSVCVGFERYSHENPTYKSPFINSVFEFAQERGYITQGQYNALVETFLRLKMDKYLPREEKEKG